MNRGPFLNRKNIIEYERVLDYVNSRGLSRKDYISRISIIISFRRCRLEQIISLPEASSDLARLVADKLIVDTLLIQVIYYRRLSRDERLHFPLDIAIG